MIELLEIEKHYQMGEITVKALDGVSFDIDQGETVVMFVAEEGGVDLVIAENFPESIPHLHDFRNFALPPHGVFHVTSIGEGWLMRENEEVFQTPRARCFEILIKPVELFGTQGAFKLTRHIGDGFARSLLHVIAVQHGEVGVRPIEGIDILKVWRSCFFNGIGPI